MSDNVKSTIMEELDSGKVYDCLSGYLIYCVQNAKNKSSDKEKDLEKQEKEARMKESKKEYEENKRKYSLMYDALYSQIQEKGKEYLVYYVEGLKKLYSERKDSKKDIKSILVSDRSLQLFKSVRNNMDEFYPLMVSINETFPVDDFSEISLSPRAALYGSEICKTQRGATKKLPLRNEDIQKMLDLFLAKQDYKRFGEWIIAILVFSQEKLVDGFQMDFSAKREELKRWAYEQIEINDDYKKGVNYVLFEQNMFNKFIEAFSEQSSLKSKQIELENKVKCLEGKIEEINNDHEARHEKQYEIIKEKDESIEGLRIKLKDYERCKEQLTCYIEKYKTQVDMNERITTENERRISEIEEHYDNVCDELTSTSSKLEDVQLQYTALQSDYSLKNNELIRLKEMSSQKEMSAKVEMMKELVSGINEQFFYLTMFYLELKDTGKLGPESIDLFADTLENFETQFERIGIKKIGVIDQKVLYDSSIHVAPDSRIANGEQVVISGYGWMIGDEVYIKAPVEKGE